MINKINFNSFLSDDEFNKSDLFTDKLKMCALSSSILHRVCMSIIGLIATFGNVIVIYAYHDTKYTYTSAIYIICFAFADIVSVIFIIPQILFGQIVFPVKRVFDFHGCYILIVNKVGL